MLKIAKISIIQSVTAIIFLFISNILLGGAIATYYISKSLPFDENAVSMPLVLLSTIVNLIFIWLALISSKHYLQKKAEVFDARKATIFSTILIAVYLFSGFVMGQDTVNYKSFISLGISIILCIGYFIFSKIVFRNLSVTIASTIDASPVSGQNNVQFNNVLLRMANNIPQVAFDILFVFLFIFSFSFVFAQGTIAYIVKAIYLLFFLFYILKGICKFYISRTAGKSIFVSLVFNSNFLITSLIILTYILTMSLRA